MLRVRERERLGIKDIGAPESLQSLEIAGQEAQKVIGVPRESPAIQQRVAEVPRDVARQAACEWPGEDERDE
jgi:hypothetical protein